MQEKKQQKAQRQIILDTNFLLIPGQFGVDIFTEIDKICAFRYELVVLEQTIKELETLTQKQDIKGKDKQAAKLALQMIKNKAETQTINIVASDETYVDQVIINMAKKDKTLLIATQDKALKQKLKDLGNQLIILRQKKHIIIE